VTRRFVTWLPGPRCPPIQPTGLVTRLLVSAVLVLLTLAVVALVLLALAVLVLRAALAALAGLVLLAHAELLLYSVLTLLDLLWMLLGHLLGLVLQVVKLAHCGLRFGRRLWRPSLTAPTPYCDTGGFARPGGGQRREPRGGWR
jgi:hypothetical protein